jgi:hypothetical protein
MRLGLSDERTTSNEVFAVVCQNNNPLVSTRSGGNRPGPRRAQNTFEVSNNGWSPKHSNGFAPYST